MNFEQKKQVDDERNQRGGRKKIKIWEKKYPHEVYKYKQDMQESSTLNTSEKEKVFSFLDPHAWWSSSASPL